MRRLPAVLVLMTLAVASGARGKKKETRQDPQSSQTPRSSSSGSRTPSYRSSSSSTNETPQFTPQWSPATYTYATPTSHLSTPQFSPPSEITPAPQQIQQAAQGRRTTQASQPQPQPKKEVFEELWNVSFEAGEVMITYLWDHFIIAIDDSHFVMLKKSQDGNLYLSRESPTGRRDKVKKVPINNFNSRGVGWTDEKMVALVSRLLYKKLPYSCMFCNERHYMNYFVYGWTCDMWATGSCPMRRDLRQLRVGQINHRDFYLVSRGNNAIVVRLMERVTEHAQDIEMINMGPSNQSAKK